MSVGRGLVDKLVGAGPTETSVEVGLADRSVGVGSAGVLVGRVSVGTSVEIGSEEMSVGREGRASEDPTATGEATSEGK